jgi:general secretion pathway protein I
VRNQRGFTLLEILVAAAIMGVAVAGVMGGLAASVRNVARITEYDRAAMLARMKMDALLVEQSMERGVPLEGIFTPAESGGAAAGWRARVVPLEGPSEEIHPGEVIVERIDLEIWWMDAATRRSFTLEGVRRGQIPVKVTP